MEDRWNDWWKVCSWWVQLKLIRCATRWFVSIQIPIWNKGAVYPDIRVQSSSMQHRNISLEHHWKGMKGTIHQVSQVKGTNIRDSYTFFGTKVKVIAFFAPTPPNFYQLCGTLAPQKFCRIKSLKAPDTKTSVSMGVFNPIVEWRTISLSLSSW